MFNAKRLDPTLTKPTWFKLGAEDKVALVPSVMPTPAFLVYDSFDGEIGAMVLYERWMTARTHDINAFPKFNIIIQAFLKALVVSTTAKEAQARLNPSIFIQTLPPIVNQWKKVAIAFLFRNQAPEANQNNESLLEPAKVPSPPTVLATPQPIPPTI